MERSYKFMFWFWTVVKILCLLRVKIEDLQILIDVKEETLEQSKKKLRECLDLVKETSEMYE